MSKNVLMISVSMLKERTAIHDNIDEKLIFPEIKAIQDLYILPLCGSALFNKLITTIDNGTITSDATLVNYKLLLDDYLIDTLCNYVVSELPLGLTYQFWNKGVAAKTTDNSSQPSMSDLFDVASKYKRRAEEYAQRARLYLRQYSPTLYPEYITPGSGVDTVIPERQGFNNPIYLGDVSPYATEYMTYEERYQSNLPRY
jgi:hypothetical protein